MSGPSVPGVTDLHVHVQPWRQLKPAVMEAMRRGHEDHWDFLLALMDDPKLLLETMDRAAARGNHAAIALDHRRNLFALIRVDQEHHFVMPHD